MTSLPEQIGASWNLFLIFLWRAMAVSNVLQDKWEKKTLKKTKKKRYMSTFIQGVCAQLEDFFFLFFLNILPREDENTMRSSQREPSGTATWTPTACWTVHPQM